MAGAQRWHHRHGSDRPFSVPSIHEAAHRGKFPNRLGWHRKLINGAAADVDGSQQARLHVARLGRLDGGGPGSFGRLRKAEGSNRRRIRRGFCHFRFRPRIHCRQRKVALPASGLSVHGGDSARHGEGYLSAWKSDLCGRIVSRETWRTGIRQSSVDFVRLFHFCCPPPATWGPALAYTIPSLGADRPAGRRETNECGTTASSASPYLAKRGATKLPEHRNTSTIWFCPTCSLEQPCAVRSLAGGSGGSRLALKSIGMSS